MVSLMNDNRSGFFIEEEGKRGKGQCEYCGAAVVIRYYEPFRK